MALRLTIKISQEITQNVVPVSSNKDNDNELRTLSSNNTSFKTPTILLYCIVIIAVLSMIVTLMVKILCNDESQSREETRPNETSKLWLTSDEIESNTYGTLLVHEDEDNMKSGKESCSKYSSSSEDEKICLICYDDQRSCFFVPCRHRVTCYTCTIRIVNQEIRACPICRSCINKVGKFQTK